MNAVPRDNDHISNYLPWIGRMGGISYEYVLKGLFLGLWAYLALLLPDSAAFARVIAWTAGGLGVGLVAGMVLQVLRGYKPTANLPGFLLLALIDSPFFIYLGVIGGLAAGMFLETDLKLPPDPVTGDRPTWIGYFAVGGAILGYGFHQLRAVKDWKYRFGLGAVVGAIIIYLAISYLGQIPAFTGADAQRGFAVHLLLGLPFFYLLTFCSEADESEAEIMALCAGLGVSFHLMGIAKAAPNLGAAGFLFPAALYFVCLLYTSDAADD